MKAHTLLTAALLSLGTAVGQAQEASMEARFTAPSAEPPKKFAAESFKAGIAPTLKAALPAIDPGAVAAFAGLNCKVAPSKSELLGGVQAVPAGLTMGAPGGPGWTLADGRWIWTSLVEADAAAALRLRLTNLQLPAGAALRVIDPTTGEAEMEHTAKSLAGQNELWTESVFGCAAIVEVILPAAWNGEPVSLNVAEIVNFWKSPFEALAKRWTEEELIEKAGACNLDVTCYATWANTKQSVASYNFIQGGGSYVCSGTVINDSDNTPGSEYFLTANHCVSDQTVSSTTEFYWFYQTAACNGVPPSRGSVPRTTGAAFLAGRSDGALNDFTLLRMNQNPPAGVTYAGWTTTAPAGQVASIHHPGGEFKRICFGNTTQEGNYWRVVWSQGTTEGGSSGSAMFDSQQRIVGQLLGGTASCANPTGYDVYGRFDLTYPLIENWLNPTTTPPPNDNFASATVISGATGNVGATTAAATREGGEPNHGGAAGLHSVWFRWTAPANGYVEFAAANGSFAPLVGAYTGNTLGSLSAVTRVTGGYLPAAFGFNATAGATYQIAVDTTAPVGGSFDLKWVSGLRRAFTGGGGFAIPDSPAGPATSSVTVSGMGTTTRQVAVKLNGLNHTYLSDLGGLLLSPSGRAVTLFANAGGSSSVTGFGMTFHPNASQPLAPTSGGVWLASGSEDFTSPAPAGPYGAGMDSFNGANPNGVWRLYIQDFAGQDIGSLASWDLEIISEPTVTVTPFRITNVRLVAPTTIELTWQSISGVVYRPEIRTTVNGTWQQLPTVTANGTSHVWTHNFGAQGQTYYQIVAP